MHKVGVRHQNISSTCLEPYQPLSIGRWPFGTASDGEQTTSLSYLRLTMMLDGQLAD